jgi:hypothetical protein
MSTHISPVARKFAMEAGLFGRCPGERPNPYPRLDPRCEIEAVCPVVELAAQSYSHDEIEAIQDADYLLQALQSSLWYRNDLQN